MFCMHCGKEIADGSVFCSFCGKKQGSPRKAGSHTLKNFSLRQTDKKKGIITAIAAAAAVLVVLVLCLVIFGNKTIKVQDPISYFHLSEPGTVEKTTNDTYQFSCHIADEELPQLFEYVRLIDSKDGFDLTIAEKADDHYWYNLYYHMGDTYSSIQISYYPDRMDDPNLVIYYDFNMKLTDIGDRFSGLGAAPKEGDKLFQMYTQLLGEGEATDSTDSDDGSGDTQETGDTSNADSAESSDNAEENAATPNTDATENSGSTDASAESSIALGNGVLPSPDAYFGGQLARNEDKDVLRVDDETGEIDKQGWLVSFKSDENGVEAFMSYAELIGGGDYALSIEDIFSETVSYLKIYTYIYECDGAKTPEQAILGEIRGDLVVRIQYNGQTGGSLISLYYDPDYFSFVAGDEVYAGSLTDLSGKTTTGGDDNGSNSSDQYNIKTPCGYCNKGDCKKCGGRGYLYSSASKKYDRNCTGAYCRNGTCSRCDGDGWLD